jgi:hypothetical protein
LEARDIHLDRSSDDAILREDVVLGGVTYSFNRLRKFRPYAKFEPGLGNVDYLVSKSRSYHQSRTVTGFGGGVDYIASRRLWVRFDYEFEYIPDFFVGSPVKPTSIPLKPQSISLGAMYHFRH